MLRQFALLGLLLLVSSWPTKMLAQESTPPADAKVPAETKLADKEDEKPKSPTTVDKPTIEKLERYLTGSKWTGNFTVTGTEKQKLTPETYEIVKARKLPDGDLWALSARIKYGKWDTVVDLPPMEIKVVGDSPMLIVDKMTILGMGTFDARVLIRNNKYAGTWAHDDVGGHLFGSIERKK